MAGRHAHMEERLRALPFKGRVGWGWGLKAMRGMDPIPIPAFPLKGKEESLIAARVA